MSRAYRIETIRVRDSLSRDLAVSDEICTDLEVLEILPPKSMGDLLRDSLKKRGFAEDETGKLARTQDDLTIRVDPETGTVTIRIENVEHIQIEGQKSTQISDRTSERERERIRQVLQEALQEELAQRVEKVSDSTARRQVSAKLEASLGDVSIELDEVVNEVTREALKQKAASLGEIREISEDPEAGSLTIRVKV